MYMVTKQAMADKEDWTNSITNIAPSTVSTFVSIQTNPLKREQFLPLFQYEPSNFTCM